MKLALDTNIIVCAEGVNGDARRDESIRLLESLPVGNVVLPVQVLGEFYNVLVRKAGYSRSRARMAMLEWSDAFMLAETTPQSMFMAADVSAEHKLSIWDSLILAIASQAGCRVLLSEDLHQGFTWGGVTVVNPFAPARDPLLDFAIEGERN